MYHIGIVLPAIPGYSETFIYNKINGLLDNGFKVILFVCNNNSKTTDIASLVPIYRQIDTNNYYHILFRLLSTCIFHPLRSLKFLRLEIVTGRDVLVAIKNLIINSHILGKRVDWLHFGFATTAISRENVGQAMGAKIAVSFRGFDIGLYPYKYPGCYNLLWKKVDKIHTISDALYKKALELGLSSDISMKKITPAVGINLFQVKNDNYYHRPIRILSVGRLTWVKGFEYSINAVKILQKKGISFEYKIVGNGNCREALIYAVHQLKLTYEVSFLGVLNTEEVIEQMAWADIYIQPSIQEGFCNSVLEAQAMGLKCIVTDSDGLTENVLNGQTGWVVQKRSPEKIAEKIVDILYDKVDDLNKITSFAINRVKSEFNLDNQNKLFREFYLRD